MTGRLFVLIVTSDPRLERQALCAVREAGCLPMLGHADETCPDAVRRIRPDVVLVDATHPCATSVRFFEDAAAMGVRVIALAPDARHDDARALAQRHKADCITLPTEYDLFRDALRPPQLA